MSRSIHFFYSLCLALVNAIARLNCAPFKVLIIGIFLASGPVWAQVEDSADQNFLKVDASPGHYRLRITPEQKLVATKYLGDENYGEQVSRKEFDLKDENELQRARSFLASLGHRDRSFLYQIPGSHCLSNRNNPPEIMDEPIEALVHNLEKIHDVIFSQFQNDSLPGRITPLDKEGEYSLPLTLFSQTFPVKVTLGDSGQIVGMEWKDKELAQSEGLSLEEVEDEQGKSRWVLKSEGVDVPLMVFEKEFMGEKRGLKALLIGDKLSGPMNHYGYEENFFALKDIKENEVLPGRRERIESDRPDFQQVHLSLLEPDEEDERNMWQIGWDSVSGAFGSAASSVSNGVQGLGFKYWYDQEDRQEAVKGSIISEADKTLLDIEAVADLFEKEDIEQIAEEISINLKSETNQYRDSLSEVKPLVYAKAYERFGTEVVERLFQTHLKDQPPEKIEEHTQGMLSPFRDCLREAKEERNSNKASQCLETFKAHIPERITETVLDEKLKGFGLEDMRNEYIATFRKCLNRGEISEVEDPIQYAQQCLYKTIVMAADRAVPQQVATRLKGMGLDVEDKLTEEDFNEILSHGRQCLRGSHLIRGFNESTQQLEIDPNQFGSMKAPEFESSVHSCIREYTAKAGRVASGVVLENELSSMTSGGGSASQIEVDDIREPSLQEGYDRCSETLLRNRPEDFDPLLCEPLIKNRAIWHSAKSMLQGMMGEEWENWSSQDEYDEVRQCFQSTAEEYVTRLREDDSLESENLGSEFEQKNAQCLSETIVQASKPVAVSILQEKLNAIDGVENLDISQESLQTLASDVQQCFRENLQAPDFQTILEEQSRLTDSCALEMLRKENFQSLVLGPLLEMSLKDAGLGESQSKEISEALKPEFLDWTSEAQDLDDFLELSESFRSQAVLKVVDLSVRGYLEDFIDDSEEVDEIMRAFDENVMRGEGDYRQRLLQTMSQGDGFSELGPLLGEFKIDAVKFLSSKVLKREGDGLVEKELLQADQVEDFVASGERRIEQCLSQDVSTEEVDSLMDECLLDLKEGAISWVVNKSIDDQLNGEMVGPYLSQKEKEELKDRVLTEDMRRHIALTARSDDAKDIDRLARRLYIKGIGEIGPTVLNQTLEKFFTGNPEKAEEVTTELNGELNNCLSAMEPDNLDDPPPHLCLNRVRKLAASKLISYKFQDLVSPLYGNEPLVQEVFQHMAEDEQVFLRACHEKVSESVETEVYERHSNQCITKSVLYLVESTLEWFESTANDRELFAEGESLKERFSVCRSQMEEGTYELEEMQVELTNCLSREVLPTLTKRLTSGMAELSSEQGTWGPEEAELFQTIGNEVSGLFDHILQIGVKPEDDGRTPARENPTSPDHPPLFERLEESLPNIQTYVSGLTKMAGGDSNELVEVAFAKIKDRLEKAEQRGEKVSSEELAGELLETQLMDRLIQGVIAKEISLEAGEALKEFVPNPEKRAQFVARLSSSEVIQKTLPLDSPQTQDLFGSLKEDYLKPLIAGEIESEGPPEKVLSSVKYALVQSNEVGAFTETLMGPLIQEELDASEGGILVFLGKLLGHLRITDLSSEDFEWEHLRTKDSAPEVIDEFSEKILGPILLGQMDDEELEEAKEDFAETMNDLVQEES